MDRVYLTRAKYEELLRKLDKLKKVDRHEIAREIGKAREKGDLRENAEYVAAKEKQAFIEKEIAELEDKLSRVEFVDNLDIDISKINIGATVCIENLKTKDKLTYHLVGPEEADISQNKISVTSPVGKALLGHKNNERIEIQVPAGLLEYKIIKFEYST